MDPVIIDRMWNGQISEEEKRRIEAHEAQVKFENRLYDAVTRNDTLFVSKIVTEYNDSIIKKVLNLAYSKEYFNMVKVLVNARKWENSNDLLFYASWLGDTELVEKCIKDGATLWERGLYGACKSCCTKKHFEIAKKMIALGARDFEAALHALSFKRPTHTKEYLKLLNYMLKRNVKKPWHNLYHVMPYFIDKYHMHHEFINTNNDLLHFYDKCTIRFILAMRQVQKHRLYNVVDKFMSETHLTPFICGFSSSKAT